MSEDMFYLVVREYRGRHRVLFISTAEPLARVAYSRERERLRNGNLELWNCSRQKIEAVTSGGYNRTRW